VELEKVVADLMQKVERRFYGKYRGFVESNRDPKRLGRLTLRIPSVFGDEVITGWAMPCVPYGGQDNQGFLCIPEPGAGVWVEFEEGDLEFPIWVGTFWGELAGVSETPALNEADGQERAREANDQEDKNKLQPSTRKILKTGKGHTIQFEDADGKEMVTIVQRINKDLCNVITLKNDGITINSAGDVKITGKNITIEAKGKLTTIGNPIHLNP
jgi:uncharacterized protein involved in type VI secretion and phage assembly